MDLVSEINVYIIILMPEKYSRRTRKTIRRRNVD